MWRGLAVQPAADEGQGPSWEDCWAAEALLALPPPGDCQAVLSQQADASVAAKVHDPWNFGQCRVVGCSGLVDWGRFHSKCSEGYPGCYLG